MTLGRAAWKRGRVRSGDQVLEGADRTVSIAGSELSVAEQPQRPTTVRSASDLGGERHRRHGEIDSGARAVALKHQHRSRFEEVQFVDAMVGLSQVRGDTEVRIGGIGVVRCALDGDELKVAVDERSGVGESLSK